MALIYRGEELATPPDLRVIDWREHGLTWALGKCGTRKRREKLTQFVWHWTGGVGNVRACHRVLTNRGLSVQLFLDGDGTVYQYVDLDTVCSHAGSPTNGRSIGIEQQCVGHGPGPGVRLPETVHGLTRQTAQFTIAQQAAARLLRLALAPIIPIKVLPDTTAIPLERRNRHVGDLAHYQISASKRDPGVHCMQRIAELAK